MAQKKKRSDNFIISSGILAFAQVFVRIIGLFYRVPLKRIVGDVGIGYYGFTYEIYSMILLLSASAIPTAVSLLISKHLANKEYKNANSIFTGALAFAIVIGTIFTLFVFFGADWLADTLYGPPAIVPSLRVVAPTILISCVMGVYRGYFQGKNAMMPTAVSQIIEQIFNAFISIVAAYVLVIKGPAFGAAGSTLGTCMGALAGFIFIFIIYRMYKPVIAKQLKRDKTKLSYTTASASTTVMRTMAPIILSTTIYQISGIIDSSLFSKITQSIGYSKDITAGLYGIYSGEFRLIFNVPMGITSSIAIALIPMITTAVVIGNRDIVIEKIESIIRLTTIVAIPCAIGLLVLATPVMHVLFGPDTQIAINLLRLGSVSIILYSLTTVTTAILQGLNNLRAPVINSAIALAIHVLFLVIMLRFADMNIYALAFGDLVFTFTLLALNLYSMYKTSGFRSEYLRTYVIPFIASFIMGGIAYFIYKVLYFVTHREFFPMLLAIIVGIIVYFISIVLFGGIDEDEMAMLPKGQKLVRICRRLHLM